MIDDLFTVTQAPYGTWQSTHRDGTPLITSGTEENCINATRWYLGYLQEKASESIEPYVVTIDAKN